MTATTSTVQQNICRLMICPYFCIMIQSTHIHHHHTCLAG